MTKATCTFTFVTLVAATPIIAMDAEIDGDGLLDETEVVAATEVGMLPATEGQFLLRPAFHGVGRNNLGGFRFRSAGKGCDTSSRYLL